MERVRKLFSGRKLLRLGRAQRLWANHTADARWHGEFRVQNARSVFALNQARAEKTNDHRRVRLRSSQSASRCCEVDSQRARRSFFQSLAGDRRFLLVERRLAERRSQKTR